MPADGGGVTVPLSLFSGLVTELAVPDLPEGLSPDNQDIVYLPGSVGSRPGLHKVYASAISGNVTVVYQKTYVQPNGQPLNLILDSAGNLWKEDVTNAPGTLVSLGNVPAGTYAQSCSAFGREYIAISDGIHGAGVPLQFDGTFLDRVTQDGPGAPPTITNSQPPSATIQGVGAPVTVNIALSPSGIIWQDPFFYQFTNSYWYRDFKVTTTTPHGLATGDSVTISGSTSTPSVDGTWDAVVTSATTFQVGHGTPVTGAANGGGGTIGQTTASGNSLVRSNNVVVAVTSAAHGFQVGWQVQVSGIANTNIGGGISAISRDGNGVVTVTTTSAHGLPAGASIAISGVTDATYDGTFVVVDVLSSTEFQYSQAGSVSSSSGGNVQDIWTGTFYIQSVPSTTSFTYQQLGANDVTTGTGTATILGQVSPGTHQCVVMFLTRQGYLTAPSVPVSIVANGTQQLAVSNIPLGPANVVARVLGFTGAGGGNYFTLLTTPLAAGQIVGSSLVVNDNSTTSVIVDFSDNTLFGGTGIDIPGRNQFAQVVLGPCAGFFGYASRLFSWGEYNKVQNLTNPGFDGGFTTQSTIKLAGSGANDGGAGTAWTNPSNVTSASSYADVSLSTFGASQNVLCETFGFALTGTLYSINVAFDTYGAISGAGSLQFTVQLLKAGVPFGTPNTLIMPNSLGSAGAPATFSTTFPVTGLTASDVNATTFGVEIKTQIIEVSSTATAHIRNVNITVTSPNPLPLGWSAIPNSTGTAAIVTVSTPPGFALQMTSAGTTQDAMIYQYAATDSNGIAIIQPNTQYSIRFQASAQAGLTGNLVFLLWAPTAGWIATASISVASLPTTLGKFFTVAFNAPTGTAVSSDTQVQIYLESVTNTGVITVDEVELIYAVNPYLDNKMRGSYVNGPEQFDGVTGVIGPASDSSPLRCLFEMRDIMYMDTAAGRHETVDNATGEPSTWSVRELSQAVGALSIKSSDTGRLGTGDSGEQFEFTASRSGLYIFWGGEMVKISQEIQTIWESINFAAKQTIWVKNDPVGRRCYVGVPLNGATAPNTILVMDYRELNSPEAIAATGAFRQSYSGRMIAVEIARKWTKWSIASNSCEILTLPNAVQTVTFGAGNGQTPGTANGFGNIYYLDAAKLTDDDYGQIVPYWTTYFFVSNDQEQALQLDSHRKLATYFTCFVTGTGQTSITPLSDTLANAYTALAAYPLNSSQNHDYEWNINVDGERIAMKIGSVPLDGTTDNGFNLQKLALTLKKHPWSFVRGSI